MSIHAISPAGPSHSAITSSRQCLICWEEGQDFPQEPLTALCRHPAQACVKCLYGTVRAQLDSKRSGNICCPTPDCRAILTHNDIQKWSEIADFEKSVSLEEFQTPTYSPCCLNISYDTRLTRSALSMQIEFVNCLNTKCRNGQLHPMGGGSRHCFTTGGKDNSIDIQR
jgi:hypothetical protein